MTSGARLVCDPTTCARRRCSTSRARRELEVNRAFGRSRVEVESGGRGGRCLVQPGGMGPWGGLIEARMIETKEIARN